MRRPLGDQLTYVTLALFPTQGRVKPAAEAFDIIPR